MRIASSWSREGELAGGLPDRAASMLRGPLGGPRSALGTSNEGPNSAPGIKAATALFPA